MFDMNIRVCACIRMYDRYLSEKVCFSQSVYMTVRLFLLCAACLSFAAAEEEPFAPLPKTLAWVIKNRVKVLNFCPSLR